MNFRPELAVQVMAGRKTVTRRVVSANPRSPWFEDRCSLKPGGDYAVCPGRGKKAIGRIKVTSVTLQHGFDPIQIDEMEALCEGFSSAAEFQQTWLSLQGSLDPLDVWRIEFEPVQA